MHQITGETAERLAQRSGNGDSSETPARGTIASAENADHLEQMHDRWMADPASVDPSWRSFFEGFELGIQQAPTLDDSLTHALPSAAVPSTRPVQPSGSSRSSEYLLKQARIYNLLFAYRTLGHQIASLDPLELAKPIDTPLDMHHFKLEDDDLETVFDSGKLAGGGHRTLGEIVSLLKSTYTGNIGVEYMHMQNFEHRRWLRDRMETCSNRPDYSQRKQRRILNRVLAAELLERFLHTRYVGQKRFSLEGGETLIPMLDTLVQGCPKRSIRQLVMGMSHRGRLNVLANILNKSYKEIFNEFDENFIPETVLGDGDVKYHLGFDCRVNTIEGVSVGISLAPNPSHLEAVGPVVQGKARAYQRILNDTEDRTKVVPILMHGDAALIGQGVVQETLNMSQLDGYKTGGTIHIAINNQIGFTTVPHDARTSIYCTSIAKMLGVPIFHVNGDDPVAAVYVMELALDFRQEFGRDVFIDLQCYRRHGHNEGDEPNFTQPTLYSEIDTHPKVSERLIPQMIEDGTITQEQADEYIQKLGKYLEDALNESKAAVKKFRPKIRKPLSCPELLEPVSTAVDSPRLKRTGLSLTKVPDNHKINSKLQRLLDTRLTMIEGKEPVDWAFAEHLAFATLLDEGVPIRLSGQDCRRGTFSQRHSVFYDLETRERYIPLKNVSNKQASFCVYNSPLSEYGVLGFDFGYSLDYPNMLCIWEAQFGDFANGAQIMIDQYICSSESKWGVTSGIVLLLPHGYHGQGPEHSSARLERFLTLAAEDNIQVANCSTPAQYFHILRRQGLRPIKKPLVIMTPKGMLRDKRATSKLDDFSKAHFEEILPDPARPKPEHVERVVLCSGKVFFDLDTYRKENDIKNVALIRVEQLYPLHEKKIAKILKPYLGGQQKNSEGRDGLPRQARDLEHAETAQSSATKSPQVIWCQEESENNGAWRYIEPKLRKLLGREIHYAGRDASASPATGSLAIHQLEQTDLLQQALER
jgi:2-oxoglutarate dehydrogenase E1 component